MIVNSVRTSHVDSLSALTSLGVSFISLGQCPCSVGGKTPEVASLPELKYSLLTQFRKLSGMRPTIARRISPAAISLNSCTLWSLKKDECGVQIKLGASFNGPGKKSIFHKEQCSRVFI